jgi:hypothetical protein
MFFLKLLFQIKSARSSIFYNSYYQEKLASSTARCININNENVSHALLSFHAKSGIAIPFSLAFLCRVRFFIHNTRHGYAKWRSFARQMRNYRNGGSISMSFTSEELLMLSSLPLVDSFSYIKEFI